MHNNISGLVSLQAYERFQELKSELNGSQPEIVFFTSKYQKMSKLVHI